MGGQNLSFCCLMTTVRDLVFWMFPRVPLMNSPNSCYDETQGEGWNHKIPGVQAGESRSMSYRTTNFLTLCIAHPPGPSHLDSVHGSSDPTWWEGFAVRWEKRHRKSNPERQSSWCGREPRRCQRRSSGIPLHYPSPRSIGRSVYLVRRDRPSAVGVEGQIGGGDWVEKGCAGGEQGI